MNAAHQAYLADRIAHIERLWLGVIRPHPRRVLRAHLDGVPAQIAGREYCGKCGESVGPFECDEQGCAHCRDRRFPWDRVVRLGAFDGAMREWILEVKFRRWEAMGYELGRALGRTLSASPVEADVVVPVPMTLGRRLRRRIDHSATIARGVAKELGLPLAGGALRRHARPPQFSVAISKRRANIRNAFCRGRFIPRAALQGARVVLVDDITTTHSTLIEVARTLKTEFDVRAITAAVLAVADPTTRRGRAELGAEAY